MNILWGRVGEEWGRNWEGWGKMGEDEREQGGVGVEEQ